MVVGSNGEVSVALSRCFLLSLVELFAEDV